MGSEGQRPRGYTLEDVKREIAALETGLRVKLCASGNRRVCRVCLGLDGQQQQQPQQECGEIRLSDLVGLSRAGASRHIELHRPLHPDRLDRTFSTMKKRNKLETWLSFKGFSHGAFLLYLYMAGYSLAVTGPTFRTNARVFPEPRELRGPETRLQRLQQPADFVPAAFSASQLLLEATPAPEPEPEPDQGQSKEREKSQSQGQPPSLPLCVVREGRLWLRNGLGPLIVPSGHNSYQ